MKEINLNILRDSLEKLPQYEPPHALWGRLEQCLDFDEQLGIQESNKPTLAHALANLPQYEAPHGIWDTLDRNLDIAGLSDGKELNRRSLCDALKQLPSYNPPYGLWEDLEMALDTEDQIQGDLKKLPQYAAPAKVWEQIDQNLDAEQNRATQLKKGKRFRIFEYAAAAAVLGACIGAWWLLAQPNPSEGQISVTQQKLDLEIVATIREEDPAFTMVQELCQERLPACEKPEFKALKSELDELTLAKQSLRSALGNYGDDANLSAQLVKIEQERSALLRQMIQLI
jgi:hypothetical protein